MGEKDRLPGHAFISYVRENSREVDNLQKLLEREGVKVWRDKADLWPGDLWGRAIRQAITQDALVFIACFSRESSARSRSYQNEELKLAVEEIRLRPQGEPWLIPVRLSDCEIPDDNIGGGNTLRSIHWVDLFGTDADASAARLVEAVRRILLRHQDRIADGTQPAPVARAAGRSPVARVTPGPPPPTEAQPDHLTTGLNPAVGLRGIGGHQEARELDEDMDTLARRKRVLGPGHTDLARAAAVVQAAATTSLGDLTRRDELTISTGAMLQVPWTVAVATGAVIAGAGLVLHFGIGDIGLGSSLSAGTVALFGVAGAGTLLRRPLSRSMRWAQRNPWHFAVVPGLATAPAVFVLSVIFGHGLLGDAYTAIWHAAIVYGLNGSVGVLARRLHRPG